MKPFISYAAILLLILVSLTLFISRPKFNETVFTNRLVQVQLNDIEGTKVFLLDEEVEDSEYVSTAETGLTKYAENRDLLVQMGQMQDIPPEETQLVADIEQYTDLRVEMLELVILSVQTGDLGLVDDINNLGKRIEALEIYQNGLELEEQRKPGQTST